MKPPLYILGTGRSGTTLVFDLLARHPALAYTCYDFNAGNPGSRGRYPVAEPYDFWRRMYPGFPRPCRDLIADDVPASLPGKVQEAFAGQCESIGRNRLLTKWTGWSRISFMEAVTPGAQYLHVSRDARAVAASLLTVPWWQGWQGPEQWRWGPLTDDEQATWEKTGRSFFVLAGLQWRRLVRNIREHGRPLIAEGRFQTIYYEALISDPVKTMREIERWAGLPESDEWLAYVRSVPMKRGTNDRWRDELPVAEIERFNRVFGYR